MKEKQLRLIVTFYTTAEAMQTEKECKAHNIEGKLISAPRKLSADCGIAWNSPVELRKAVESLLEDKQIEYQGIHEIEI